MRTVTARCTIGAPVERVWSVATDIKRWPEVISGIDSVVLLTDSPFGQGTRWRETRRMFGNAATEEMWVTEVDQGRSYTVEAENHGARYVSTFTFTPVGLERTEGVVTFAAEPQSRAARVLGTITSAVAARSVARTIEADLKDLGAAAERS